MSSSKRIAWIGIGNMGKGMTKNLVEKGTFAKPIILYNRTTSTAEAHAKEIGNAKVVTSIADAISAADIIFICLGVDDAVRQTVETAVQGDITGKLIVDCSTIHPDTTSMISKVIEAQGGQFVACPVFGATPVAWAGQLVCVVAGPAEQTKRVLPYCEGVMGRAIIDFSDQAPSKATLLKLIGNTFILSMTMTLSEGHVLAEKSGLGSDNLHKFIEIQFPTYAAYSNRMREGDYYKRDPPFFGVDLAKKDANHAINLAKDAGTSMKIAELALRYLDLVSDHMGSKGDLAGIYGAKRKENGMDYENQGPGPEH